MEERPLAKEAGSPELLVDRLSLRLKKHALWDLLLVLCPPFFAFSYMAFYLHRAAWIGQGALLFAGMAWIGAAVLLGALRFSSPTSTTPLAARFIDEKADAKERFLTLATLVPSHSPSSLFARLRQEAAALLDRVDLSRDFPYRVKRSFVASFIVSLAVILLLHLVLLMGALFAPQESPSKELALLAEKLAQTPRLQSLARSLKSLAERLEKDKLSDAEKRTVVQELLKEIEKQLQTNPQDGKVRRIFSVKREMPCRSWSKGKERSRSKRAGVGSKPTCRTRARAKGENRAREVEKGIKATPA